jgi:hypothetical protein
MKGSSKRLVLAVAVVAAGLSDGCGADRIVAFPAATHRADVGVGELVEITLRAASFGSYVTPPVISAPVIVFLEVTDPDKSPVPGGPAQRFRFRAVAAGTAVVTFTTTQPGPTVVDTIVVRS